MPKNTSKSENIQKDGTGAAAAVAIGAIAATAVGGPVVLAAAATIFFVAKLFPAKHQ